MVCTVKLQWYDVYTTLIPDANDEHICLDFSRSKKQTKNKCDLHFAFTNAIRCCLRYLSLLIPLFITPLLMLQDGIDRIVRYVWHNSSLHCSIQKENGDKL